MGRNCSPPSPSRPSRSGCCWRRLQPLRTTRSRRISTSTSPCRSPGAVSKIEWVNPHSWIHIDVKGSDGKMVTWAIETVGPNALFRRGWKRDTLKIGDTIVVDGFKAKNGQPVANGRTVHLSTGQELFVGATRDGCPRDEAVTHLPPETLSLMRYARSGDRPVGNRHGTRSPVFGTSGVIACSQPLASAAGLQVLQAGRQRHRCGRDRRGGARRRRAVDDGHRRRRVRARLRWPDADAQSA